MSTSAINNQPQSPAGFTLIGGPADGARLRFVQRLHPHDADGQRYLLAIESDDEIERLKSMALQAQCFEAAAACSQEQKRRNREVRVNPPNEKLTR